MLIHLGSNDLVTKGLTSKKFAEEINCSLLRYNALLPKTKLVWSSILPRLYWHGAPLQSGHKIDKKRRKINNHVKKLITELGVGCNFARQYFSPKHRSLPERWNIPFG